MLPHETYYRLYNSTKVNLSGPKAHCADIQSCFEKTAGIHKCNTLSSNIKQYQTQRPSIQSTSHDMKSGLNVNCKTVLDCIKSLVSISIGIKQPPSKIFICNISGCIMET